MKEGKGREKKSQQNGMQCEELVEKDFYGDATSQLSSSEDNSTESSGTLFQFITINCLLRNGTDF